MGAVITAGARRESPSGPPQAEASGDVEPIRRTVLAERVAAMALEPVPRLPVSAARAQSHRERPRPNVRARQVITLEVAPGHRRKDRFKPAATAGRVRAPPSTLCGSGSLLSLPPYAEG